MQSCPNCQYSVPTQFTGQNCPRCGAEVAQQNREAERPNQLQPYSNTPSILSLLPPQPLPNIDLSRYGTSVRLVVQTTVLQSRQDPKRFRVIREYFVVPGQAIINGTPVSE